MLGHGTLYHSQSPEAYFTHTAGIWFYPIFKMLYIMYFTYTASTHLYVLPHISGGIIYTHSPLS